MFLKFSRVFRRNTDSSTVEDKNAVDNPIVTQAQGSSSETTLVRLTPVALNGKETLLKEQLQHLQHSNKAWNWNLRKN